MNTKSYPLTDAALQFCSSVSHPNYPNTGTSLQKGSTFSRPNRHGKHGWLNRRLLAYLLLLAIKPNSPSVGYPASYALHDELKLKN